MGKGKGSLHHQFLRVKPGAFLIEILCSNPILAKNALLIGASKLSLRTQLYIAAASGN